MGSPTKVVRAPVCALGPDGDGRCPDSSRSLDSLGHMRVMAPLRDMIEVEDGSKAAVAGERVG